MEKKTIGIIGCGNMGSAIAKYCARTLRHFVDEMVFWDSDMQKAEILTGKFENSIMAGDLEEVAQRSDLIIEAAAGSVVPDLFKSAIEEGKDIMVMSIGGLLGKEELLDESRKRGIKVLLPSGAVSGIDALKASRIAEIESVTIITRKPPGSIKGAPYLDEKKIDVEAISEETVIFEGSALEAVKGFPKNVNVSALLSLAGIGPKRTKVKIIVSPEYTKNIHEIEIKSVAGKISTRTENVPSPDNPKTSYLAVLSAQAALRDYFDTVRIGN